jgi:hypothetical protein
MNIPSNKHLLTGDILKFTDLAWIIDGRTLVSAAIIVTVILGHTIINTAEINTADIFPRRTNNIRLVIHGGNIRHLFGSHQHKTNLYAWRGVRLTSYVVNFIAMGTLVTLLWISVSLALYSAFG